MQSIRITSGTPTRIRKQNKFGQFRWISFKYLWNRKDLSWLHFYDDPRVQKRHQVLATVLNIRFCILSSISKSQMGAPTQTWQQYSMQCRLWYWDKDGRFIKIKRNVMRKKIHRTNQGSNFLGDNFCNGDNVTAPIQFRREWQSHHIKRWFFVKNRPIQFHINSTRVARLLKRNKLNLASIANHSISTSHFLNQSTVSRKSHSNSEANSSCCQKLDAWSYLE